MVKYFQWHAFYNFEFRIRRSSTGTPLRDAVEYRVAPFFGGLDHDSIWIERLTPPSLRNIQSSSNVICHLDARAAYRPEPFTLLPQSIPDRKCSHLIYSSATLGENYSIIYAITVEVQTFFL